MILITISFKGKYFNNDKSKFIYSMYFALSYMPIFPCGIKKRYCLWKFVKVLYQS